MARVNIAALVAVRHRLRNRLVAANATIKSLFRYELSIVILPVCMSYNFFGWALCGRFMPLLAPVFATIAARVARALRRLR